MGRIRSKKIRECTIELLTRFRIERPPVDVENIARRVGLSVRYSDGDDSLSGFLIRGIHAGGNVIGVNSGHAKTRQRFTIAHELGHWFLHQQQEPVHVDRRFEVYRRSAESATGDNVAEIEANRFAAELLMPEHFLERDLRDRYSIDLADEDEVSELANRYAVSQPAVTFRLMNLGYIAARQ